MRSRRELAPRTYPSGGSSLDSTTDRKSALSRTLRLMQPSDSSASNGELVGLLGTVRPRLGFSPNRPADAAGPRIEPPPSLACASGTMPAATADAAPPDDPLADSVSRQGLCVTPSSNVSVLPSMPSSLVALLPTVTGPAASTRSVNGEPLAGTWRANSRDPNAQRNPGV